MASFILIHGSWHGGWCFDDVKALLEAQGHEVIAPDLPGMGGDEATLAAVTLESWTAFTAELCRKASQKPVVLAGHSRGGLIISQAAEIAHEAIDRLVYICAMMLPSGMSRSEFKQTEETNPAFDQLIELVANGHGSKIVGPNPGAVFAQRSPPEKVRDAMQRLVTEPHGPRSARLHLTSEKWGSIPRTYIECIHDLTIPISSQRKMLALLPGAAVVTLDADHSPFLSRPFELAVALLAVADLPIL
jgi:pimeloyl-ACP methyl ester carboxylesterase